MENFLELGYLLISKSSGEARTLANEHQFCMVHQKLYSQAGAPEPFIYCGLPVLRRTKSLELTRRARETAAGSPFISPNLSLSVYV